jgi:hypothetical protein
VTAHPAVFVAVLVIGIMFGWVAAWTVLRQRLVYHRELVQDYQNRVASGLPASVATNPVKQWRIASPLLGIGAAFMFVGVILAYFAPSVDRAGYGMILCLFGLLLIFLAVALITNPEMKPIAKGTKTSVLHAVQGDARQSDSNSHGQEERR